MDFLDNAVSKAKEAFDVAYKKTNEVVSTQKQKFDVASIENKLSKDFEALGRIYFDIIKDTEPEDQRVKGLADEIKTKNERIKELREEINNAKNKRICPECNANISKDAVFCSNCGAKLIVEE